MLAHIEPLRKDKRIGSSLQARAVLTAPPDDFAFLKRHERDLPMLFIVSEVELRPGSDASPLGVAIERATGVKCQRCWRYVPAVSADLAWKGLCDRCQAALGPERENLRSSARSSSGTAVGPRAIEDVNG